MTDSSLFCSLLFCVCVCFQVYFPNTSRVCMQAVLEYLYTNHLSPMAELDPMELIALANRLCLPRLIALTGRCSISNVCVCVRVLVCFISSVTVVSAHHAIEQDTLSALSHALLWKLKLHPFVGNNHSTISFLVACVLWHMAQLFTWQRYDPSCCFFL